MQKGFFGGVVLGSACSALVLFASAALAGSGVGGVFNLGVSNTVSGATTDLSGTNAGPQLRVDNAGTGNAIVGRLTTTAPAVHTAGILGNNLATNGFGFGIWGSHQSGGVGVLGSTVSGIGVRGTHNATTGSLAGVEGFTNSSAGAGGRFENEAAGAGTSGVGLIALGRDHNAADNEIGDDNFSAGLEASGPNGIEGNSHSPTGFGVTGDAPAVGVRGTSTTTTGTGGEFIGGMSFPGTGVSGSGRTGVSANGSVFGLHAQGNEFAVDAGTDSAGGVGVRAIAGTSADDAVQAYAFGAAGDAVQGQAAGANGFALSGIATTTGTGLMATSADGRAVVALNGSVDPTLSATNNDSGGVSGSFTGDIGVEVFSNDSDSTGVFASLAGDTDGNGIDTDDGNQAISAFTDDADSPNTLQVSNGGVADDALTAEAIEVFGFVDINDDARVTGTLTKGAGAFEIDHPLDPANKYLRHSFVESPDMMNVYNGTVSTDGEGFAKVTLPAYFPALNRDYRYQLTVLGRSFAQAIVWDKLAKGGRSFRIRTSEPGVEVSWQVTGIRQDAYAKAHPIVVEQAKTGAAKGAYLHPALFGRPNAIPLGLDLRTPTSQMLAAIKARAKAEAKLVALVATKRAQALKDAKRAAAPRATPASPQQGG